MTNRHTLLRYAKKSARIWLHVYAHHNFKRSNQELNRASEHCKGAGSWIKDALVNDIPVKSVTVNEYSRRFELLFSSMDELLLTTEGGLDRLKEALGKERLSGSSSIWQLIKTALIAAHCRKNAEITAREAARFEADWTGATKPPTIASFLMAVLSEPKRRDAILGDAEELFTDNVRLRGRGWAIGLYWSDAVRSIIPLAWRAIERLLEAAVRGMAKGAGDS